VSRDVVDQRSAAIDQVESCVDRCEGYRASLAASTRRDRWLHRSDLGGCVDSRLRIPFVTVSQQE